MLKVISNFNHMAFTCNRWQHVSEGLEFLFSVTAPRALELLQTLDALLHSALAVDFVIPGAYVHSVAGLFLLSHHFYKQGDKQRGHKKSISRWTETQTAKI